MYLYAHTANVYDDKQQLTHAELFCYFLLCIEKWMRCGIFRIPQVHGNISTCNCRLSVVFHPQSEGNQYKKLKKMS